MEGKSANLITAILFGVGLLLILALAFDVIPRLDNLLIFLGLACFIVAGVIKKLTKDSCCK